MMYFKMICPVKVSFMSKPGEISENMEAIK